MMEIESSITPEILIPNSQLVPKETEPLVVRISALKSTHRKLPEFVVALSISRSKTEAVKRIRMSMAWLESQPKDIVEKCEELADEMRMEPLLLARTILSEGLVKATMVKVQGLDSRKEALRQRVATEIIERNLGKANQPQTKNVTVEITSNLAWGKQKDESPKDQPGRAT